MGIYMSTPNREKETIEVKDDVFHAVACSMQGREGKEGWNTREMGVYS